MVKWSKVSIIVNQTVTMCSNHKKMLCATHGKHNNRVSVIIKSFRFACILVN